MKTYNDDGLRNLANAIVIQAADDYRYSIDSIKSSNSVIYDNDSTFRERVIAKGNRTKSERRLDKIERFFSSEYGDFLSRGLGSAIGERLREERLAIPTR